MDATLASVFQSHFRLRFIPTAAILATYILIHSFLRKHSHTKAALAVKKAAKDIVILKDDVEIEEPHLDTIIQEWKAAQPVGNRVSSSYVILFRSFML